MTVAAPVAPASGLHSPPPHASETGPADVPGRARRMRSAPARHPAGGAERTARAEPAARPARRPGRPRPRIGRRLGGAAPRGPAAPPADGGEPGARAALPAWPAQDPRGERRAAEPRAPPRDREQLLSDRARTDRKSTRLNSSHDQISYAVFCLKKKKKNAQM